MHQFVKTNYYFSSQPSTIDYYPFGQEMPGRVYSASSYRMGFNGQWKDSEFTGTDGGHYEFKFREYDSRIGRFWSVDPLFKDYPWNSTYAFAENDVIRAKDLEGLERHIVVSIGSDVKYRGEAVVSQLQNHVTITHYNIKSTEDISIRLNEILKSESSLDARGIASVTIFSHGSGQSIFAKREETDALKNKLNYSKISSFIGEDINYSNGASIYLGGCWSGNSKAFIKKGVETSFAQLVADKTNNTVIAGDNRIGPTNPNTENTDLEYKTNNFYSFKANQKSEKIGSEISVKNFILQSQRNYETNSITRMPVLKPDKVTPND